MSDFWERRKAAVRAEEAAEEKTRIDAEKEEEQTRLSRKSDEEILNELDLPDPDSMVEGDDFSAFLKSAVPERIRLRALRRLWTTNPVLANLDGLIEYGEDFTDAATVLENLQTAYRVGEGMARHVMAMAEQAQAEQDGTAPDEPESVTAESETEEMAKTAEIEKPDNLTQENFIQNDEKCERNQRNFSEIDESSASKPRWMRYSFKDRELSAERS